MEVVHHASAEIRAVKHRSLCSGSVAEKVVTMQELSPKWLRSTKGAPFTGIGSLEADILAVVWDLGKAKVRDVYEILRERRTIAYTTVMTVMNNLVKKNLLTQDRSGIAYEYTPAIPGREVAQTVLDSVVQRLLGGQRNVATAHLLGLKRDLTPDEFEQLRSWAVERFER
jgi:predicted transcriptional regulator